MNRGPKRSKTPTNQRGKVNPNLNKSYHIAPQTPTDLNVSTYDGRLNTTHAVDQSLPLHMNDLADVFSTSMNAGINYKSGPSQGRPVSRDNSANALREINLNQGNRKESDIVSKSLADLSNILIYWIQAYRKNNSRRCET
jgi:hypothetical protein